MAAKAACCQALYSRKSRLAGIPTGRHAGIRHQPVDRIDSALVPAAIIVAVPTSNT